MNTTGNVSFLIASATYAKGNALTATHAERLASKRRTVRDAAETRRIANRQTGINASLDALRASFRDAWK